MDIQKELKEIKNYEVVSKFKDIVITYSLSDCSELVGFEQASVIAKEKEDSTYDLLILNVEGTSLAKFNALDAETLQQLDKKNIIFAGISENTNDIEEVLTVSSLKVEKINKIKFGR